MPLILSEAEIRSVLSMDDLITTMEQALVQFSAGLVAQPLRAVLEAGTRKAYFGVMPAYIPEPEALGTKLVSVFKSNRDRGLTTHLATIVLLDPETGELMALLDGRYITEARTAAVSAVSTKWLASPDAGTLAILGSGVQARSHLEALACVRTLRDVRVWSPHADSRDAFARDMQPRCPAPIRSVGSARTAVEGADLITLVTASREPVISADWVTAGAHVCAVGACRPDQREMETSLVRRARLFVDSRTAAFAEAGDIVIPLKEGSITESHVVGELGELAAGRVTGREHASQVTIFKSLGMAVEDVAAAHLAHVRAAARGLGRGVAI